VLPSDLWRTPPPIVELVHRLGPIDLDPCGHPESVVGARRQYLLERGEDGLVLPWAGFYYCNPPYSRGNLDRWLARCREQAAAGARGIALVPSDTSTRWWHYEVRRATAFCLLSKRARFLGAVSGSPKFGSALIYWGPRPEAFAAATREAGWVFVVRRAA
jgi:hypothetical protein